MCFLNTDNEIIEIEAYIKISVWGLNCTKNFQYIKEQNWLLDYNIRFGILRGWSKNFVNKWYTSNDFQYIKEWNWRLDYNIRLFEIFRGGSKNVVNNGFYTSQVTDFSWSHDGRMALICYCDGFVLVGSVAGQMYWSSMLNLDQTTITCGVWSPDDQQVSSSPTPPSTLTCTQKWCPTGEIFSPTPNS